MTFRLFLFSIATASLSILTLPVAIFWLISIRQHSTDIWERMGNFPSAWFLAAHLSTLLALLLSGVSFYRRDFIIGSYAIFASVLGFLSFAFFRSHVPIY
jgi:hypothetical protein